MHEEIMKVFDTEIKDLKVIELSLFKDKRGFFVERYNEVKYREAGLPTNFLQDNHSRSSPNVLRGLHMQPLPPQGKLVGVLRGRIYDVAVDVRPNSPTFGKYFGIELSDENGKILWVPPGFAHGFCVLGNEEADVLYKVSNLYNPKGEIGIKWDDPEICIKWPISDPIISDKDNDLPSFADYKKSPPKW